jgi:hypothetical protein
MLPTTKAGAATATAPHRLKLLIRPIVPLRDQRTRPPFPVRAVRAA